MSGPLDGVPEPFPYLRLPSAERVFTRRAARFGELARGHAAGDFLEALGHLARAQAVAASRAAPWLHGRDLAPQVPLRAVEWPRPSWRDALAAVLAGMAPAPLPPPARAAVESLGRMPEAEVEAFADALLAGATGRVDLAAAPFVAASLQAHFTAMASQIPADRVERAPRGCPVCGSPPVASVVLGDDKLRYLACSLCATEWHLTRLICSSCGEGGKIRYLAVEGGSGAAKAEACGDCGTYLKVFYLEREPRAEPFADDAASLALDLLVAEEGYERSGVNLFLLAGAET